MSNPKDSGRVVVPKPCNCILPYRVYSALVTQEGTDAPTFEVLNNTLGFDFEWVTGTGDYIGTPTNFYQFDPLKTILYVGDSNNQSYPDWSIKKSLKLYYTNLQLKLTTGVISADTGTGALIYTPTNELLYRTFMEIRVYP